MCVQLLSEKNQAEVHQLEAEKVALQRKVDEAERRARDMHASVAHAEQRLDELKKASDAEKAKNVELEKRYYTISSMRAQVYCQWVLFVVYAFSC
jgi:predicted  nucleic acid-binding Zn-ribbon protein